jgi:hypothetical protein
LILFTILIEEMMMMINSIVVVVVVNVFFKRDIYTPARPYLKRSFFFLTVTKLELGEMDRKVGASSNKQ